MLFLNWQKESWQTFEETSGYVRPERVNKWPNSMTDIWWWWWWHTKFILHQNSYRPVSRSSSHSKEPNLCVGWIEGFTEFAPTYVMSHLFVKYQSQPPLAYNTFYMLYWCISNTFYLYTLYVYTTLKLLYIAFHHGIIHIYVFYWISMFPWATFCIMATICIKRQ